MCDRIRTGCAHAFGEIATILARQDERDLAIADRLSEISRAVTGNGDTEHSLITQVSRQGFALKMIGAALVVLTTGVVAAVVNIFT